MIHNILKLLSGLFFGSFATFINVQLYALPNIQTHINILNGLLASVVAVLTSIFLYWQIKKIRRDLKNKSR
ncbi:MAG: hypothetical protein H8E98_04905 [Bacteroidetes bacterium]|nr:hypothetical protein [Bacteroidota bacterium]